MIGLSTEEQRRLVVSLGRRQNPSLIFSRTLTIFSISSQLYDLWRKKDEIFFFTAKMCELQIAAKKGY